MSIGVPILKQDKNLVVPIQTALTDADWSKLLDDLCASVGKWRTSGVVIDVTTLDVLDSFATRTLHMMAQTLRLRGAQTVIVGIQPDVAIAMIQLGLIARLENNPTGLDLKKGLTFLQQQTEKRHAG